MNTNDQPTWLQFENLVSQILQLNNFSVNRNSLRGDKGFDLVGDLNNEAWAIEVKYYLTAKAQPSLIEKAAIRLLSNAANAKSQKGMLVIFSISSPELRRNLEIKYGITFIDRFDLAIWASKSPQLATERMRDT